MLYLYIFFIYRHPPPPNKRSQKHIKIWEQTLQRVPAYVCQHFNPLMCKPAKPGQNRNWASCLTWPKVAVLYISGHGLSRPQPTLTFPFVWGFYFGQKRGWILTKNRKLQHSKYSWIALTPLTQGIPWHRKLGEALTLSCNVCSN